MTPSRLASRAQSLPPILHMLQPGSMSSCSKAARGLFVLMRTDGIFTANALSPSPFLRQYPYHYSIRAGQNLPDKEFRYLRTVIVTAAVHRGFSSLHTQLPLTFRHRAGVSPYTSTFVLAETCVFGKQLLGPILCGLLCSRHPFSRSYGVNLPSSLTAVLPLVLGFSPHLPVSVCGTGTIILDRSFSWQCGIRYLSPKTFPHYTSSLIKRIFLSNLTKCLDTHPIVCTSYPSASLHL